MLIKEQKGVSLLETVLYIGILAIVLPMVVIFSIGLIEKFNVIDPRIRMEQKAGLLFSQLSYDLTSAQSIDVTSSVLSNNDSKLVWVDNGGDTVTIDRPTVTVDFGGETEQVRRLRLQRGIGSTVWLTGKDIDVPAWYVSPVRNDGGDLVGLNIRLEMQMLNASNGAFRNASYSGDTTYYLFEHTNEL